MKETVYETRDYGEFVIRLQYVNTKPSDLSADYEPAIVVCRPKRIQSRCAWIIMLSSAFKYVDDPQKGGHSIYMQHASYQIAKMLGLSETKEQAFKIAEAILGNLEDLINMPPVNWQPKPIADISANIEGTHIQATVH
jgi:hypothetical protein